MSEDSAPRLSGGGTEALRVGAGSVWVAKGWGGCFVGVFGSRSSALAWLKSERKARAAQAREDHAEMVARYSDPAEVERMQVAAPHLDWVGYFAEKREEPGDSISPIRDNRFHLSNGDGAIVGFWSIVETPVMP